MSGFSINSCNSFSYIVAKTDYEWLQIIQKLRKYGISSSKNKSRDVAMLREFELKEAENAKSLNANFLTLNQSELETIREENKKNYIENNSGSMLDSQKASKILGEQLYLAIMMKKQHKTEQ